MAEEYEDYQDGSGEEQLDNDEISAEEEGFQRGYEDDAEQTIEDDETEEE